MAKKTFLEVSLDPNADPTKAAYVTITSNPAVVGGNRVRWIEADSNLHSFSFAGIELDHDEFSRQKILVKKNRIVCANSDTSGTDEFEYVIWVRYQGELYDSTDRSAPPGGGKAVIRNQ